MKSRSPEKSVGVADVKVLQLDDQVATLHLLAHNVEVTVLAHKQHLLQESRFKTISRVSIIVVGL